MKKSVFVLFAIILMSIVPIVIAVEISMDTLPDHRYSVIFRNSGKLVNVDSKYGDTGSGEITISSTSDFFGDIDLLVKISKQNDAGKIIQVLYKKFEGLSTNKIIYIDFKPDILFEEMIVDSFVEEEVEEVVEEEVEEVANSAITVNAVSGIKDIFTSRKSYYIVGVILALFAIAFIIQIGRNKIGSKDSFRVVKFNNNDKDDERIEDAEKKLAEAKEELDDIRDRKKKLAEAKARFQKDKEELSRLE